MIERQKTMLFVGGLLMGLLVIGHQTQAVTSTVRLAEAENEYENEIGDDRTAVPVPAEQVNTNQVNTTIDNNSPAEIIVTPETYTPVNSAANDVNTAGSNTAVAPVVTPKPAVSSEFPWVWVGTRVMGIVSYLLLFLMAVVGMLLTTGALFRVMSPASAWTFHRALGMTLGLSVALHLTMLMLDRFLVFKPLEVFVPFVSNYKPLLVALGIGGFYWLVLLLITSLWQIKRWPHWWRAVHALSFVMFTEIFLHGILIGTDRHEPWMRAIYWSTASIVFLTAIYRLWWKWRPTKIHQVDGKITS